MHRLRTEVKLVASAKGGVLRKGCNYRIAKEIGIMPCWSWDLRRKVTEEGGNGTDKIAKGEGISFTNPDEKEERQD